MLVAFELETIWVGNCATGLHTQQRVMRCAVFAMRVVTVICRQ